MSNATNISTTKAATGVAILGVIGLALFGLLTTPAHAAVAPTTPIPVPTITLNDDGSLSSHAG